MENTATARKPIIVAPDQGRAYDMGRMRAIFKADCEESEHRYSVSEWWLEPRTAGPGVHFHPEDHVYYVLGGTLTICANDEWSDLAKGSYVLIPGGTPHTFENRGPEKTGFISFTSPGGFEHKMPDIAAAMTAADLRLK